MTGVAQCGPGAAYFAALTIFMMSPSFKMWFSLIRILVRASMAYKESLADIGVAPGMRDRAAVESALHSETASGSTSPCLLQSLFSSSTGYTTIRSRSSKTARLIASCTPVPLFFFMTSAIFTRPAFCGAESVTPSATENCFVARQVLDHFCRCGVPKRKLGCCARKRDFLCGEFFPQGFRRLIDLCSRQQASALRS